MGLDQFIQRAYDKINAANKVRMTLYLLVMYKICQLILIFDVSQGTFPFGFTETAGDQSD
jgi:hypothetical protein